MRQKTIKRIINVFIALLLLCPILIDQTTLVSAQTGSVVATAIPSAASQDVGEQVTVSIHFDMTGVDSPDNALGSFTSTLTWDPAIISYDHNSGLQEGLTGAINTAAVESGLITFNGANTSGVTGEFDVLTITFDVISAATTTLDLEFSAMSAAGTFNSLLGILTVNDGSVTGVAITYNLTVTVDPIGAGTTIPPVGVHPYDQDTLLNVTAQANAGYQFVHWSGDCDGSGVCQVTMNEDKSVSAHFVEVFEIFLPFIANNTD